MACFKIIGNKSPSYFRLTVFVKLLYNGIRIKMNDIHAHEHIIKRRGISSYKRELAPETGMSSSGEDVLDMRIMKLVFVSMIAVVAYGLSWLVFTL